MKKSTGREFFEVFRRAPELEKQRNWWARKAQPEAAQEEAKPKAATRKRDTTTPAGRVALTFSHEALVIYVIVLGGMLVGSFVMGYSSGRSSRLVAENTPVPPPAEMERVTPVTPQTNAVAKAPETNPVRTLSVQVPPAPVAPLGWTLRVMSGIPNGQSAQQVAADFKAMGYDAFVEKPAKEKGYAVNVGHFGDYPSSAEANALKVKVRGLDYKGHKTFADCYWTKEGSSKR